MSPRASQPPADATRLARRPRLMRMLSILRRAGTVLLYLLMLACVLALWNTDAPQFIYVAF